MFKRFATHVLPAVIKPLRVLWNEIIGFVFIVFAIWSLPSVYRGLRDFNGNAESFFKIILAGIFALMMGGFGVFSFIRARRISRS
ncbi:MAG: hypothetical protein FJW40_05415 [Acidobacteria bacterium]|nr:hypothetical protein [Acidobacteriota bacterium]